MPKGSEDDSDSSPPDDDEDDDEEEAEDEEEVGVLPNRAILSSGTAKVRWWDANSSRE